MSDNVFTDWLGNKISQSDWVLYSSKSTNIGMNLGLVEYIGPSKKEPSTHIIQIRVVSLTTNSWSKGRLVTLQPWNPAYKSVTKYPDNMIKFDLEVDISHLVR